MKDGPEFNPYVAPEAPLDPPPVEASGELARAEAMRRRYLAQEMSVRSVGTLHFLAAFFFFLPMVMSFATMAELPAANRNGSIPSQITMFGTVAAIIAFQIALGVGLQKLQPWARWVEAVLIGLVLTALLAAFGFGAFRIMASPPGVPRMRLEIGFALISFAVVAAIPSHILYLLLSSEGAVVFSPEYRAVIERTPHIKHRTSRLAWFVLGLIGFFLVIGVVGSFLGWR